jgi:chromatin structure-remodeling complex protein RSC7
MQDVDESAQGTPQVEGEQDDGDLDQAGSPAADSDIPQIPSEPSTPPAAQNFPARKRRLGRPPKNKPPDWDTPRADDERGSETGTPQKRKRGRPAGGGWRGRPRQSNVFEGSRQTKIDKEGTMVDVIDDEADLPEDPEGEQKVDKLGHLKGGRDYRVRVFTVKNRGKRLYMLSTEPARCCGFRDSYLFFTKHLKLHKVIVEDDEKRDLIDRGIIPHSYKGRSIGVVTARSVFREFGAKIIIGGKRIIDDYYVDEAKAMGFMEGELADPHDQLPPEGKEYNKNQYVAWHGASAVYHTGVPTVPTAGKPITGKRKVNITSTNWQYEHAHAARLVSCVFFSLPSANLGTASSIHTLQRLANPI